MVCKRAGLAEPWRGSRIALAGLGMAKLVLVEPALADLVMFGLSFGQVFGLIYDR